MFCKQCGAELPSGASVCPKCGKALETIVPVDETKTESVATAAPTIQAEAVPEKKARKKSDKLTLPAVLLAIAAAGLVYLYMSGTFGSIMNWFTSEGEKAHVGRPEMVTEMDPIELLGNIGAIVAAGLLGILALVGLVLLFQRLGRKFSRKDG